MGPTENKASGQKMAPTEKSLSSGTRSLLFLEILMGPSSEAAFTDDSALRIARKEKIKRQSRDQDPFGRRTERNECLLTPNADGSNSPRSAFQVDSRCMKWNDFGCL
jgi:hypothetical protein